MNIKKIVILSLVIAAGCIAGRSQNGFNLPYAQFGIGISEQPFNMPMVTRFGGAMYTRSANNYINPLNPASYAGIETESFVFDMGLNIQLSTLRNSETSMFDADGNLGYLMLGLPVTRWWKVAAGLMPYSNAEYESVGSFSDPIAGSGRTVFDGTGGSSMVFIGSAFNILNNREDGKQLQVGFNVSLLTGHVQRAISYTFDNSDSTYWMPGRKYKQTTLSNVLFDFGLQYRQPLGGKFTLGVGLTYKPYRDMNVTDEALIYTFHTEDETLADTIFPTSGGDTKFESRLEQAHTFGVGISLECNKRWAVSFDATFADWAGVRYTENPDHLIFGAGALTDGPYSRYALGIEKIGNMDAAAYAGRISWSLGAHFTSGLMYLNIDGADQRIDDWGVGAGFSMPMRKGRSLLTLSVGYSSLGTVDLLQRNCVTFGIGVSSCERWFTKRKYN